MDLPLDCHNSYDLYDYENSVTFFKQLLEYSLQSGEKAAQLIVKNAQNNNVEESLF